MGLLTVSHIAKLLPKTIIVGPICDHVYVYAKSISYYLNIISYIRITFISH